MEVSTQSNIAFEDDESFSAVLIESIGPKNTRNGNELEDARFWLGQLGKIRTINEEKLLKLADKVDVLEVDYKAKNTQLQSEFEAKFREMENQLKFYEEKCMKLSEQVAEANNTNSVLKEYLVDIQNKANSAIHEVDCATDNQVVDLVESDDEAQSELQYEQVEHVEHGKNVEQVETEPSPEINNDETLPVGQNPTEQSGDGNQHDSVAESSGVDKENIRPQSTPIAAKNEAGPSTVKAGPSTVKAEVAVIITAKPVAKEGVQKEAGANESEEASGVVPSAVVVKEEQPKTKKVFLMKPGAYVKKPRKRILVETNDEDDEDDNDDDNDEQSMVTEDGYRVVYVPMKKSKRQKKGKYILVAKQ